MKMLIDVWDTVSENGFEHYVCEYCIKKFLQDENLKFNTCHGKYCDDALDSWASFELIDKLREKWNKVYVNDLSIT